MTTKEEETKTGQKHWWRWILGSTAIVLLLVMAVAYYYVETRAEFLPGIYIGDLEVSDLAPADAVNRLEAEVSRQLDRDIEFYIGEQVMREPLRDYFLPVSAAKLVDLAWQSEKERPWWQKVLQLVQKQNVIYPLSLQTDAAEKQRLQQLWVSEYNREPVDATIQIDAQKGLLIVPEQTGITVNAQATLAQLPENIADIADRYEIVHEEAKPAVVAADLQNMGELGSYTTKYNTGEVARSHNLVRAAEAINAKLVPPGEVFSFNATVGQRSASKGYRSAMIINNGRFEPGLGGGVCQVSSTLYNAALLSGLEIVERHNHNLAVAYVPLGLDATVVYGVQDFKFKNNTDAPVYIQYKAGGGSLTATVYGDTKYKQKIELSYVVDRKIPFGTVEEVNADLEAGATKVVANGGVGYEVRSYRKFLSNNGEVLKQEQLANDIYRPLNRIVQVGPAAAPDKPDAHDHGTGAYEGVTPVADPVDNNGGNNGDGNENGNTNDINSEKPDDLKNLDREL